MRPYREHLTIEPGASWSMLNRRLEGGIPFQWHHHPEYELTLTLNSQGQRFVGSHVGRYEPGDLVLVGPNLPHSWVSHGRPAPGPHVALVFWFRAEWLGPLVAGAVEWAGIGRLLARAGPGLAFGPDLGLALACDFEAVFAAPPAERLASLLRILARLAEAPAEALAPEALAPEALPQSPGRDRIDRVLEHLHQAWPTQIRLAELADIAALSVSGLHRQFKAAMRVTVTDYLARLRIGAACAALSGTKAPIARIATECGYDSLANFNRQFKRLRGMTPRSYRAAFTTPS